VAAGDYIDKVFADRPDLREIGTPNTPSAASARSRRTTFTRPSRGRM
jgi:hypothetical protein